LTWGADGTARLWEAWFPRPLSPADQLLELEARSGLHVGEDGWLQSLRSEDWRERQNRLESVQKKNERP
jgi:hypothetical protein